jgi:YrbI family 3-deoxy-D-manno-octulosonate 8-phosphate phosphatase
MVASLEILAIIPARGGSKGIPHKNIRSFCGYPLLAYSIAAAQQSQYVTRTIVSTDDAEIAAVAREYGADVPFVRPDEFAQDNTLDLPVFQHALNWLAEHEGYHPDLVVQLRPTSPIRPADCVDQAIRILLDHPEADSVRGVVPAGQNPHKMWRIAADGRMQPLLQVEGVDEPYNAPRQKLPQIYWQTGHIDVIRPQAILFKNSMSGDNIQSLLIDPRYTVDIDNLADWARYEWLAGQGGLDMVFPGRRRRPLPAKVDLIVMDFDGVLTDNRVWVDENGREMVAAYRSDSLGMRILRQRTNVKMLVLSMEVNPVVAARCAKMGIPCVQGIEDKPTRLAQIMREMDIAPKNVIYMGNDVNDTPCFPLVGCAVAPADAQPEALRQADLVLGQAGGHGAVRELCSLLMEQAEKGA